MVEIDSYMYMYISTVARKKKQCTKENPTYTHMYNAIECKGKLYTVKSCSLVHVLVSQKLKMVRNMRLTYMYMPLYCVHVHLTVLALYTCAYQK